MVILTILNYILAINIRQDIKVLSSSASMLQSSISANPAVLSRCRERETAELFVGKMSITKCSFCSLFSGHSHGVI